MLSTGLDVLQKKKNLSLKRSFSFILTQFFGQPNTFYALFCERNQIFTFGEWIKFTFFTIKKGNYRLQRILFYIFMKVLEKCWNNKIEFSAVLLFLKIFLITDAYFSKKNNRYFILDFLYYPMSNVAFNFSIKGK